jgi:hypothetical protein
MPEEISIDELQRSRDTSARLMEQLARKIGASRSVHSAAEIGRSVRTHPAWWLIVAGFAGFAAGSLIRSLGHRAK